MRKQRMSTTYLYLLAPKELYTWHSTLYVNIHSNLMLTKFNVNQTEHGTLTKFKVNQTKCQPFHHFIKLIQMPLFKSHLISFNWIHSNHHHHYPQLPSFDISLIWYISHLIFVWLAPASPPCCRRVAAVLPRCSTGAYRPSVPWHHGTKEQRWRTASSRAHRTSHNVPIA